jgi:molecular chaperone HscA
MLIESFEFAETDLALRNLLTERVEAERILAATRGAFESDTAAAEHLLDADVRAAGIVAMQELEHAMAGDDHLKIRAAIEQLDLATKPFAQARMNRAVEAQLRGLTLDEAESQMGH